MEFAEYPKRVYKGEDSIIVNTKIEENEFLGVKTDDKKDDERVQGGISQGKESRGIENDGGMQGEIKNCGNVQTHEGQESPVGVLKRKAGRPPKPKV